MFDDVLRKLEAIEPLIDAVNKEEITALSHFLYERIVHPDSYVVFLGETSSGKTSIINGFVKQDILPVKAIPTTAAITEIDVVDSSQDESYLAIFKDARVKLLNKEEFLRLCESPTPDLERLRLTIPSDENALPGLKLFDTPGFDSIVQEHEEVLKEFIPNADSIVYVVNYRTGILRQSGIEDNDFVFLGMLKELIRKDVEIILLINRCPQGTVISDRRVKEICGYAHDLLGTEPEVLLFEDVSPSGPNQHALPFNEELSVYLKRYLHSESRLCHLEEAFDSYVKELYLNCDKILRARYASALLSDEDNNAIIEAEKEHAARIRESINTIIEPTFQDLIATIPRKIDQAKAEINKDIERSLSETDRGDMDEMIAFTNAHLLPFTIGAVSKNIVIDYIEVVLTDLNNRLEDLIQKEILEFNNQVSVRLNSNLEVASMNLANKLLQETGKNALGKYFIQYGGMGGANAGVANAASHLLKEAGDLFGKTFSRETHNALKHALKKIGATSMKAVGAAIAVVVELVGVAYQYAVWKVKLAKKIRKGVDAWGENTIPSVQKDLLKLKEANINTIWAVASDIETSFEEDVSHDADLYEKQVRLSDSLGYLFN